ncbi:MAG: replicative DNA helicase [Senegalia sp. (in: firmicutes)]|uniref:replicative DNA helicase n=1 Tax=Senegalia sp. (in: firmicutes) TaxID=1924098 RepID=UPI003F9DD390
MEKLIHSTRDNYRERMQRIFLFDPLYSLRDKKKKDYKGRNIDYFGLGLLTLLFFFENMLSRNKNTGVKELALFLKEMTKEEIDFDDSGFQDLSRTLIEAFRPASGKRNSRKFYNWNTRKDEEVFYSILKAAKSDIKTNTQYYTLDEQGLELIFATKEYFSEFQLSINQLVLRKQLEKGEFIGALRQIEEMHIDVETLNNRIIRIKHEVQRSIISNETHERYKDIVEDINRRLEREQDEFNELQSFVKDTKEKLAYELKDKKEQKTYELIIKIERELRDVHLNHRKLFDESIVLKTKALEAAQESLYYIGIDAFNFEQEILGELISHPLPLESSRTLVKPFLSLEKAEIWSPLIVFDKQRITKEDREENIRNFSELISDEEVKKDILILQKNFAKIMEYILIFMKDKTKISLEEFVNHIKKSENKDILNERVFYEFWLILHQKSPINIELNEDKSENIFKDVVELLYKRVNKINVIEDIGIVKGNERYSIKNMILTLEEK